MNAAIMASTAVTLFAGSVWRNFQLWAAYSMDFSLVLLLSVIALAATVNLTYRFLAESQPCKIIKGMFDQYVLPTHSDSMLKDPDNCFFEEESKELIILFSGIQIPGI